MHKSMWVGVGHLGAGIVGVVVLKILLRLVWDEPLSPTVASGAMATMVVFAARMAYDIGKKDGLAEAQNRTLEESEGDDS